MSEGQKAEPSEREGVLRNTSRSRQESEEERMIKKIKVKVKVKVRLVVINRGRRTDRQRRSAACQQARKSQGGGHAKHAEEENEREDEEEDCVGNAKAMQQEMKEERARERGRELEEMKEVTASREAYDYRRRGQTCKAPGNNSLLPLRASIPALTLVCVSFFSSFSFSFCCPSALFRLSFCQAHRGRGHVRVSVFGIIR